MHLPVGFLNQLVDIDIIPGGDRHHRHAILNEQPDAIIDIVDATNLERNLYLTMQLLELERPVVLAVNFMGVGVVGAGVMLLLMAVGPVHGVQVFGAGAPHVTTERKKRRVSWDKQSLNT